LVLIGFYYIEWFSLIFWFVWGMEFWTKD